ncbi:MAG: ABC transporter permease [Clostridia bacterium]|nr:ABC transporter permease [Clostridia bacterium]
MSLRSFIYLDIKRLFNSGRTALFALLAPLLGLLVFGSVVAPMLAGSPEMVIPYAVCNEDGSEAVTLFINLISRSESLRDLSAMYPVADLETGYRLLESGQVLVLVHIPQDFYQRITRGEDAQVELTAYPAHTFEQTMIFLTLDGALSAVGQSQNLMHMVGEAARRAGAGEEESETLVNEGLDYAIRQYMERRTALGKGGALSPTGDYLPLEYYISAIFALFAAMAMMPALRLTAADCGGPLLRRGLLASRSQVRRYCLGRLLSGALLIFLTLAILLPICGLFRSMGSVLYWGRDHTAWGWVALLVALPVISLTFSALALAIGGAAGEPRLGLWCGFYAVLLMAALSGALLAEGRLPAILAEIGHWTPLKPAMRIIAGTLFSFDAGRYAQDMLRLCIMLAALLGISDLLIARRGGCL